MSLIILKLESKYILNRTWQKLNINKIVIYYIYENFEFNFISIIEILFEKN
jgi:hypothetical protein